MSSIKRWRLRLRARRLYRAIDRMEQGMHGGIAINREVNPRYDRAIRRFNDTLAELGYQGSPYGG